VKLELVPLGYREADAFIEQHHRHHQPTQGFKFILGAALDGKIVGVAVVGLPIAAPFDDGWTAEVRRTCTDGTPNVNSFLYGASWRAARALGYRRLITYTLQSESGVSLRAAGWRVIAERRARSWARESGRPRVDKSPYQGKLLWEAPLEPSQ
jgi:hypothetical protein